MKDADTILGEMRDELKRVVYEYIKTPTVSNQCKVSDALSTYRDAFIVAIQTK